MNNLSNIDLKEKAGHLQKLRDDIRQRFRAEYLGRLRENVKLNETCDVKYFTN